VIITLCGVTLRAITAYVVTQGNRFSLKERFFVAMCWIPKATVQATISGLFLTQAKTTKNATYIQYGEDIQTIAIIAIMLCAPIGSILISCFGELILDKPEQKSLKDKEDKAKN
jgi:hypothetical protein